MNTPNSIPRPEHPRPDFQRDTFLNLNGTWQFAFDDADQGMRDRWYLPERALPMTITVPFAYQTKASGVHDEAIHAILWYQRTFQVPDEMRGNRILLRFGAVDYACRVFINGRQAGEHTGGYTPFTIDATAYLADGENDLRLRVEDAPDCTQPRGKQYWKPGLMGCWYTPSSGIWQTVYMEAVGACALRQIRITPDLDNGRAELALALDRIPQARLQLEVEISFQGRSVKTQTVDTIDQYIRIPVDMVSQGDLIPFHIWSPGQPNLYDVSVRLLQDGRQADRVRTYFGMRKVEVVNGRVLLNNSLIYQKLVLDQGYWPDTLLTPPSDQAIRKDVELTLAMGFNGARKHQKLEDPRYYYWADKLGLLVWGELPATYQFAPQSIANLACTLDAFIDRDYNHPCIIAWVPLNESWGVPQIYANARQQETGRMLYHYAKAADGTRIVSSNDGWEQVTTDICALHDYAHKKEILLKHFESRETVEKTGCASRMCYADSETPTGKEAFIITEFGGIAFSTIGQQGKMGGMDTWGYHDKVADEAAFIERFSALLSAIAALPYNQGYCYTQLTDVMQEINGLLTPNREPKIAIETIRSILDQWRPL